MLWLIYIVGVKTHNFMLDDFLTNYRTLGVSIIVLLIVVVGWLEERLLGRTDIACVTWFFGVLVASIMPFTLEGLGTFRWIFAMFFFFGGSAYLFWHYKKSDFRHRRS